MKFVRLEHDGRSSYGILDGDWVHLINGTPFSEYSKHPTSIPIESIRLLAPSEPSKIVAVGINYKAHASEFRKMVPSEPVLFLKPPSAILDPSAPIRIPRESSRVDFEAELAVVIKRRAYDIAPEEVPQVILGYTCFNDVTARDFQKRDGQ